MSNNTTSSLPAGIILHGQAYDYKITDVLGQGTFGITYRAKVEMKGALGTLDSNMYVAIKEFFMKEVNGRNNTSVTSGSTTRDGLFDYYREKFEREARNLSTLQHPNIVRVLESFQANGTVYYAMEYISGQSLDSAIVKAPAHHLAPQAAVSFTQQIGSALSFMHSKGMLHLDVKPANVMVKTDGTAVLIDFGLSKQYTNDGEPESSTKVGAGTPGYAPLEQASYREGKGFPTMMDVYALGGTLYKMLTGQRPPEASEILNDGFPIDELKACHTPADLARCVQKAMAPLKKDRYQTIDALLSAIAHCDLSNTDYTNSETTSYNEDIDIIGVEQPKNAPSQSAQPKPAQPQPDQPRPVQPQTVQPKPAQPTVSNNDDSDTQEEKKHTKRTFLISAAIAVGAWLIVANPFSTNNQDSSTADAALTDSLAVNADTIYYIGSDGVQVTWAGPINSQDKPEGHGTIIYPENDKDGRKTYTGNMSDGIRDDDSGILIYRNGNRYEGSFKNDNLEQGILYMPTDGLRYEGTFSSNQFYNGKLYKMNSDLSRGKLISSFVNGKELSGEQTASNANHASTSGSRKSNNKNRSNADDYKVNWEDL